MQSFKPSSTKKYKPCCPNHGEPLEGIPSPMPSKGIGMCPVSGAEFEYEAEVDATSMVQDKNGNITKGIKFNVTGDEKANTVKEVGGNAIGIGGFTFVIGGGSGSSGIGGGGQIFIDDDSAF